MTSEKKYIEDCKKFIEEKFSLEEGKLFKQRDFDYLSDLIFEKSGVRISISTLKRILKNSGDSIPQIYTLNALANTAGYESWSNFKLKFYQQKDSSNIKSNSLKSISWWTISFALIICTGMFLYLKRNVNYGDINSILFKSRRVISSGVPNTVVFEYDISKANFDSAFIQHTWDKRLKARINKINNFQTFIYYFPGFHTAKLILNDKTIKQQYVNIKTDGWEAMTDATKPGYPPQYISKKDIYYNNSLFITPEKLLKNKIPADEKSYSINFYNVGDPKDVSAENFTFKTRIKMLNDRGSICHNTSVSILCENGFISVPFCKPGCSANIQLHVSEVFKHGRTNDLSAFGIDLSNWRDLIISVKKKKLTVFVDNKKKFSLVYNTSLGRVTGFHFKFSGSGAVDMVKLYNLGNELKFSDDFEN